MIRPCHLLTTAAAALCLAAPAPALELGDILNAVTGAAQKVAKYQAAPLPKEKADAAMVFVGGMADEYTGIVHGLACNCPWLPITGDQTRAYYHWHMGDMGSFDLAPDKLAAELQEFRTLNPAAPVVLIGHSLGASTALQAAARLQGKPGGSIYLLTLDPVNRLVTPKRPDNLAWWGNSYIVNSQDSRDFIPVIGGRWNECKEADYNIRMDGLSKDDYGYFYQHGGAMSQLFCKGDEQESLFTRLCREIKKAR